MPSGTHFFRSSVCLTHLDPEITHSQKTITPMLQELVIHSILHNRVYVSAVDLVMNPHIAEFLHPDQGLRLRIFGEIMGQGGAVQLISKPLKPEDVDFLAKERVDPIERPIKALSLVQEYRRTFQGEPFRPTPTQLRFYDSLDQQLQERKIRVQEITPPVRHNTFAAQFRRALEHYELMTEVGAFRDIPPTVAEQLIRYSDEQDDWIKEYRTADLPKGLDRGGYLRTEAYLCIKVCAKRFAMRPNQILACKNLVQSVYARDLCQKLDAYGRYGGRLVGN